VRPPFALEEENVQAPHKSPSRHLVDPELLPLLDAVPTLRLSTETLTTFRDLVAALVTAEMSDAAQATASTRLAIPGPSGAPDVRIAIYRPSERTETLPVVLQIHGGGFVAGGIDALEARHRELAATLQCCVVAVDYRLAPETRFPGAIEDCYAALGWLVRHSRGLGVSPDAIALMGESAGGGLAAALALLARDRGEYRPAFQHLIYPMLDDRTATNAPPSPHAGEFLWTAEDNRFGWTSLLGSAVGGDAVSPYAAPARATDLSGLPPAFLMTGALDLFADEGIDYARRLTRAGVPTELHVYPGAFHGFDLAMSTNVGQAARRSSLTALARALDCSTVVEI